MLYMIGTGIYDERDISLKAIDSLKKCKKIYAEFYTCPVNVNIPALEKQATKKIQVLNRKQVEEQDTILNSAKKQPTAFLVGGDALSATTHTQLMLDAKKSGIKVKVIHASSIFTAIAETGLQLYKFGKTVSLPLPQVNYFPTTPYTNLKDNIDTGLHTLLLLDIGMSANTAIDILMDLEKKMKKNIFTKKTKLIVAAHLGGDSLIKYNTIENLKKTDFGALPHTIVIPGKLHFTEEEYLKTFST